MQGFERMCRQRVLLLCVVIVSGLYSSSLADVTGVSIASTCVTGSKSGVLPPDMDLCTLRGLRVNSKTPLEYTFEIPVNMTYDITMTLAILNGGQVDMTLLNPGRTPILGEDDPRGNPYLFISRESQAASEPGKYTLRLETQSRASVIFSLRVSTQSKHVMLAPKQLAIVSDLVETCCPVSSTTSQTCSILRQSINKTRVPEDDLCHITPNMCDSQGTLIRLSLFERSPGLACTGGSLPTTVLSQFTSLRYLDVSNNMLMATAKEVGGMLAKMPNMTSFYAFDNLFTGELDCTIVAAPRISLLLQRNNFTGAIPPCFLTSPTLQILNLNNNSLTGQIPTPIKDSALQALVLSQQIPSGCLTGSIPPEISQLANLALLYLEFNCLEGPLPDLPVSMVALKLGVNGLTGSIPDSVKDLVQLEMFDVGYNKLSGPLPPGLLSSPYLSTLDLQNNSLSGGIDTLAWATADSLYDVYLNNNSFTGPVPAALASPKNVKTMSLAYNQLTGTLEAFASAIPTSGDATRDDFFGPMHLDLTDNKLTGPVPDGLMNLDVFNPDRPWEVNFGTSQVVIQRLALSGNALTGSFPMWVYTALSPEYAFKAPFVELPDSLNCPMPGTIDSAISVVQKWYKFNCTREGVAKPIGVDVALATKPPAVASSSSSSSRSTTSVIPEEKKTKAALSIGAIIGVVIASIAAIAVLMVLVYLFVFKASVKKRAASRHQQLMHMQMLPQSSGQVTAEDTV